MTIWQWGIQENWTFRFPLELIEQHIVEQMWNCFYSYQLFPVWFLDSCPYGLGLGKGRKEIKRSDFTHFSSLKGICRNTKGLSKVKELWTQWISLLDFASGFSFDFCWLDFCLPGTLLLLQCPGLYKAAGKDANTLASQFQNHNFIEST